jgi:hypothetical protein
MGEDEKGNPGNPDMGNPDQVKAAPGKPDLVIPKRKPPGDGDDPEEEGKTARQD